MTMLPLEQMLAEWPAQYAKNRNAEFFYIPFTGLAMRVLHNQTDKAVTARGEDKDMESLMDLKKLRDYVGRRRYVVVWPIWWPIITVQNMRLIMVGSY